MPWVAGVDGCRGGWVVVWLHLREAAIVEYSLEYVGRFADVVLHRLKPKIVAVDMPIGLLSRREPGGRTCDRDARKLLGRRASSIFSPPIRGQLSATRYEQVRFGGLSRQAFHLIPKIREIDLLMPPSLQRTVFEAHPELAFMMLTDRPMKWNKKTPKGQGERLQALARTNTWPFTILRQELGSLLEPFPKRILVSDDVMDAWALAWTAYRLYLKKGNRVPQHPPKDQKGLRMEIWF